MLYHIQRNCVMNNKFNLATQQKLKWEFYFLRFKNFCFTSAVNNNTYSIKLCNLQINFLE